jgi:NitT/TauT family transport system permease protein
VKQAAKRFLLSVAFPAAAALLLYQTLRLAAGPRLFPALGVVADRLAALVLSGKLPYHAGISAYRVLAGLSLAVLAALPAAALMARYRRLDAVLSPLLFLAFPIPKVTFLPVLLLLLGLGDASKIGMIFLIVVFQAVVSLRDVFRTLDRRAFQAVRAFGGGRIDLLVHVIVPASLPALLSALRVSGGTAIAVLFIAESFATESGMGYFIMDAWSRVSYADMHCGILALALLGLALFALIDLAELLFCPWLKNRQNG